MNIKSLSDKSLVDGAITVAREEREKLTQFLHHLREINRRRLFSDCKYKSLFEMTTKHFGYSEDEAYRRISAMRLLSEVLQIDHVHPKALGGRDSSENFRLLCRACNQRAAVRAFGVEKMGIYFS